MSNKAAGVVAIVALAGGVLLLTGGISIGGVKSTLKKAGLDPETFTATANQLETLKEAGYSIYHPEYEAAVDWAWDKAYKVAEKYCDDKLVAWSSEKGYYPACMSDDPNWGYVE